jgi:drug/metabolite transporter (DMT)-like permease
VPVLWLGVVAAAISYATGILAARALGAKVSSFVGLTEVMFAVVWAWLLLGELPAPVQLAGGLLIVAGVAAVKADERVPEDECPLEVEPVPLSATGGGTRG